MSLKEFAELCLIGFIALIIFLLPGKKREDDDQGEDNPPMYI